MRPGRVDNVRERWLFHYAAGSARSANIVTSEADKSAVPKVPPRATANRVRVRFEDLLDINACVAWPLRGVRVFLGAFVSSVRSLLIPVPCLLTVLCNPAYHLVNSEVEHCHLHSLYLPPSRTTCALERSFWRPRSPCRRVRPDCSSPPRSQARLLSRTTCAPGRSLWQRPAVLIKPPTLFDRRWIARRAAFSYPSRFVIVLGDAWPRFVEHAEIVHAMGIAECSRLFVPLERLS